MLNLFHVAPQSGATIPFDPNNVLATIASAGQINVSWQDNSSNELLFRIQRQVNGGGYSDLTTVAENVVAYSDTAVSVETNYQYRVRAENGAGESGYATGNSVCLAITPGQVTGLTASPLTSTSISLSWSVPSGTATRYDIERDGVVVVTGHGSASYTDTGLSVGTEYDYRVRATNLCGQLGAWSAIATTSTYEGPVTAAPVLTATVTGSTTIDLSWTAVANASSYEVEWDTDGLFSSPTAVVLGAVTSYQIQFLSPETEYFIRVRGDSNNPTVGPWSNIEQDTTWVQFLNNFLVSQDSGSCPDAVANLQVEVGGRTDNWIVEREDGTTGNWTQILNTPFGPGPTASHQDFGAQHVAAGDPVNTLRYRCRASGEPGAWTTTSYNYDCLP